MSVELEKWIFIAFMEKVGGINLSSFDILQKLTRLRQK